MTAPLDFSQPGWLLLLPLALLPLLRAPQTVLGYSDLELLPRDRLSTACGWLLRLLAALAVAALAIGVSGPFRPPQSVERIGQGAQMVLLLDRSSSMDRPFAGGPNIGGNRLTDVRAENAKGRVARRLLAEFAGRRKQDKFGMVVFSTNPIRVLPLTDNQPLIQAAIEAGNIGRGLAKTNLGDGLVAGLEFFADQPYTGSRILLLVSDGGAKLDLQTQDRIQALTRRHRVALYWIYIRTQHSPGLQAELDDGDAAQTAPEQLLHRFFESLTMPYRAYSAENPQALQQAIDDVNRLQNLPIIYSETVPRRDLSGWCYGLAAALIALLLVGNLLEIRSWRERTV